MHGQPSLDGVSRASDNIVDPSIPATKLRKRDTHLAYLQPARSFVLASTGYVNVSLRSATFVA